MTDFPLFPDFKFLELSDRQIIVPFLRDYQPETSELSFTNLFLWRNYYNFRWCILDNFLMIIAQENNIVHGYQPIGKGPGIQQIETMLAWLYDSGYSDSPDIIRADQRIADTLSDNRSFFIEPVEEHFDYLYRTFDLAELAGRKYHSKRNHLRRFMQSYSFTYEPFTEAHIMGCLDFSDRWCKAHKCRDLSSLNAEWDSIREIIKNTGVLELYGAVIRIEGRVEALTFAEMLNSSTAVIHIEKANSEFNGIYAAINQLFCSRELSHTQFINREQDLGKPGLIKSKQSYHPAGRIRKYRIRPA